MVENLFQFRSASLYVVVRLVNRFLFLCGISPYRIARNQETLQPILVIYNKYLYYTYFTRAIAVIIATIALSTYEEKFNNLTACVLFLMHLLHNVIALILPIVVIIFHGKCKEILNPLIVLDETILEYNTKKECLSYGYILFVVKCMIVSIVIQFACFIYIDIMVVHRYFYNNIFLVMTYFLSYFYMNGFLVLLFSILECIRLKLQNINVLLLNLIRNKPDINKILHLLNVRNKIIETCYLINKVYGIHLASIMLSTFLSTLTGAYGMYGGVFLLSYKFIPFYVGSGIQITRFILIIRYFDGVANEVSCFILIRI